MFEYLMPLLLMRAYPGTLLETSCRNALRRQIDYGEERGVPWGISESAFNFVDRQNQYQYKAFGVPGLGLKRGLADHLVVAPYATALAVLIDPRAAAKNLRALSRLGLEGRFGDYDAIDFSEAGRVDLASSDSSPQADGGVVVRTYMADYLKAHPVSDAALHKEYDQIKSQIGDKEYKVRHILVENEADAKEIIVALQKGEKFEKLAERSKDTGSKVNGGDLDWNAPANFVKPFSDAMIVLPKGKFTTTPVQTQFGWHVIEVDDIREAKVRPFDEVKPQLAQRMQGQVVDAYLKDLRAKNGL
jgi:hypothetical protein